MLLSEEAKKLDKELDEAIKEVTQLEKLNELFGREPYMGHKTNVRSQKKALKLKRRLIKGMGPGGKLQYKDMMQRAKQAQLTPDDYRTIKTLR